MLYFLLFLLMLGVTPSVSCSEDKEVDKILLDISNESVDTTKINILITLASKTNSSDIKSSERYARTALELSQKINYEKGLAYSKFWLAKIFQEYDYDFTESLALESLDHAIIINDSLLMSSVYNVLGALKMYIKNNEDAMFYFNKSLGINLRHEQDSLTAAIYSNIGVILEDSSAIDYYLKAAEINKKTKNYLWLAINYSNTGISFMEHGHLEEGYDYLLKSLKIIDEHNLTSLYSAIYNNLSYYSSQIKDFEKGIEYANKALKNSREYKKRNNELIALSHLKKIHVEKSDFTKAFEYSEQMKTVVDSINKNNRLKELDLLQMKYQYEEELKAWELENELREATQRKKELTYISIILFAGLIILIILVLYLGQRNRTRRKSLEQKNTLLEKEKLSQDLELKNKELTTGVIYSIQKNKVLTSLTEEMVEIEKNAVKEETRDAINKISRKIRDSVDADAWEEFEIRFQQVHINFYDTLTKDYPDLTPNEKRLCAFLRLDMSSKEISRITGQSITALELARTRLRKKLGITNTDSNLVTFLSQY